MSYTYEQLKQMGAVPGGPSNKVPTSSSPQQGSSVPKKNYSYEELLKIGATPGKTTAQPAQPAQPETPAKKRTAGQFAGNVGKSALDIGVGFAKAAWSPIDTTKMIGSVAKGAGAKLGELILENTEPGQAFLVKANESRASRGLPLLPTTKDGRVTLKGSDVQNNPDLQMANTVGEYYKERLGSWEKIKTTMYEDPTGFALDLSGVLSGGATIVGKLDKINKLRTVSNINKVSDINKVSNLQKTSSFLNKAAEVTNPITQGMRLAGRGVTAATQGRKIGGKKYTPENIDAAQNIGVAAEDLPIFAKTTSPVASAAEAVASKGLGGGKIWDRMNNIYTKMNDTIDSLLKGKIDGAVIGRNLTKAVDEYKNNFYNQKNKLYEQALIPKPKVAKEIPGYENVKNVILSKKDPMFDGWKMEVLPDGKYKYTKPTTPLFSGKQKTMPASTKNTQELLKTLIEKEKQALKGYGAKSSPELKTYEGLLNGLGSKNMTTSDVHRTLQKLSGDIKYGTGVKTGNNAKLSLIRETLDAEFLATLQKQRPDLAAALAKADDFYKQGVKKLNSSIIKAIVENADKPDLIVKILLTKLDSIEDVKLLVEVVGQKNMVRIRESIMDVILTEAKGVAKENLQPLGISRQIKKFGEDKLQILLNPDQMKALEDLEQLSKMMGRSSKITGGSQTSFNLIQGLSGGSLATASMLLLMGNVGGATLALTPLLGTFAAGKFINSSIGRRLLAEGIELTGETGRKIQTAAPSLGKKAEVGNLLNRLYESE